MAAELSFDIHANNKEIIQTQREIEKLQRQLQNFSGGNLDPTFNVLSTKLASANTRLRELQGAAAKASATMINSAGGAQQALVSLQNQAQKTSGAMAGVLDTVMNPVASIASLAGLSALGGVLNKVQQVRGEFQLMETNINTLLGSAEKGKKMMADLTDYAAKSPLDFKGTVANAQLMLGFGIEEKKILPFMKALGDVSAGNAQRFNSLALAFSQMSAAGKLMGQDLMQMVNAGFQPLDQLSKDTGKSIGQLKEEMSKGKISAEMVQQAFLNATAEGGRYYKMSENAVKTIPGQMSMLEDDFDLMLNDIGKASEGHIMDLIKFADMLISNWRTVGTVIASAIATFGVYKTTAMAANFARQKTGEQANKAIMDGFAAELQKIDEIKKKEAVSGFDKDVQKAIDTGAMDDETAHKIQSMREETKIRLENAKIAKDTSDREGAAIQKQLDAQRQRLAEAKELAAMEGDDQWKADTKADVSNQKRKLTNLEKKNENWLYTNREADDELKAAQAQSDALAEAQRKNALRVESGSETVKVPVQQESTKIVAPIDTAGATASTAAMEASTTATRNNTQAKEANVQASQAETNTSNAEAQANREEALAAQAATDATKADTDVKLQNGEAVGNIAEYRNNEAEATQSAANEMTNLAEANNNVANTTQTAATNATSHAEALGEVAEAAKEAAEAASEVDEGGGNEDFGGDNGSGDDDGVEGIQENAEAASESLGKLQEAQEDTAESTEENTATTETNQAAQEANNVATEAGTVAEEANTVAQDANTVSEDSNTVAQESSTVATETNTVAKEGGTIATEADTMATETNTVATESGTIAEEANTVAAESNAIAHETETVATEANTVAKEGNAVASETAAIAEDAATVSKEAGTIATESESIAEDTNTVAKSSNAAATNAQSVAEKGNVASKNLNSTASKANTGAEVANTAAKKSSGLATAFATVQTKIHTGVTTLMTGATNMATAAVNSLKAAWASNPFGLILTAITAVVGALMSFKAHTDEAEDELKQFDEQAAKSVNDVKTNFEIMNALKDQKDSKILADTVDALTEKAKEYGIVLDDQKDKIAALNANRELMIRLMEQENAQLRIRKEIEGYEKDNDTHKTDYTDEVKGIIEDSSTGDVNAKAEQFAQVMAENIRRATEDSNHEFENLLATYNAKYEEYKQRLSMASMSGNPAAYNSPQLVKLGDEVSKLEKQISAIATKGVDKIAGKLNGELDLTAEDLSKIARHSAEFGNEIQKNNVFIKDGRDRMAELAEESNKIKPEINVKVEDMSITDLGKKMKDAKNQLDELNNTSAAPTTDTTEVDNVTASGEQATAAVQETDAQHAAPTTDNTEIDETTAKAYSATNAVNNDLGNATATPKIITTWIDDALSKLERMKALMRDVGGIVSNTSTLLPQELQELSQIKKRVKIENGKITGSSQDIKRINEIREAQKRRSTLSYGGVNGIKLSPEDAFRYQYYITNYGSKDNPGAIDTSRMDAGAKKAYNTWASGVAKKERGNRIKNKREEYNKYTKDFQKRVNSKSTTDSEFEELGKIVDSMKPDNVLDEKGMAEWSKNYFVPYEKQKAARKAKADKYSGKKSKKTSKKNSKKGGSKDDPKQREYNNKREQEQYQRAQAEQEEYVKTRKEELRISRMIEGSEKELATIRLDAEKKRQSIRKKVDSEIERIKAHERKAWLNGGKGRKEYQWKQERTNEEYRKEAEENLGLDTELEIIQNEESDKLQEVYRRDLEAMRDYLKEYGSFKQQQLAIEQEYNAKIAEAKNEGEKLSLRAEADNQIKQIEATAVTAKIDWYSVFNNIGGLMSQQLKPLYSELKEYVESDAFRTAGAENQKAIVEAMKNMRESVYENESWQDLADAMTSYHKAVNDLQRATEEQTEATRKYQALSENVEYARYWVDKYNREDVPLAERQKAEEALADANRRLQEYASTLETANTAYRDAQSRMQGASTRLSMTAENVSKPLSRIGQFLTSANLSELGQLWDSLMQFKGAIDTIKAINKASDDIKDTTDKASELSDELSEESFNTQRAADAAEDFGNEVTEASDELSEASNNLSNSANNLEVAANDAAEALKEVAEAANKNSGKPEEPSSNGTQAADAEKISEGNASQTATTPQETQPIDPSEVDYGDKVVPPPDMKMVELPDVEVTAAATKVAEKIPKSITDALDEAGAWAQLISAALSVLDILKSGIGTLISSLIDTIFEAISGFLDNVLSGKFLVQIGESLYKGVLGVFKSIATLGGALNWLHSESDKDLEKDIERLTAVNEALIESVDRLAQRMDDAKFSELPELYAEQIKNIEASQANTKEMMERSARAYSNGFFGIGGKHSANHEIDEGMTATDWKRISDAAGVKVNSAADFFNLTSGQMDKVLEKTPDLFGKIKDLAKEGHKDVSDLMDEYIEYHRQLEELKDAYNERLTDISFDSLRDQFKSTLLDMESDASTFADSFENMMQQAVINALMQDVFNDRLKEWYEQFVEYMGNEEYLDGDPNKGKLSNREQEDLKTGWDDIANDALEARNALKEAMGWGVDSQQSSSRSLSGMTQDTAEAIEGRLTAIQIAVETIRQAEAVSGISLAQLNDSVLETLYQNVRTESHYDNMERQLAKMYIQLQDINENTSAVVKPIQNMAADIAEIKQNTSNI